MTKNSKSKIVKAVDEVMQQVSINPNFVESLIMTLSKKGTERFGAAKKLQLIGQANSSLLYPYFDIFAKLLGNTSSVLL